MDPNNALGIYYDSSSDDGEIGNEPTSPPLQPQRSLSSIHREEEVRKDELREQQVCEEVREEEGAVNAEPPVSPNPPNPPDLPAPAEPPTSPARPKYPLDARGMQVVDSLFHNQGVRGRPMLSWKDFRYMMKSLGFTKKIGNGQRRKFKAGQAARERGWKATVCLDKPRNDEVPLETAREWGRRLRDCYGWSSDTFVQQ